MDKIVQNCRHVPILYNFDSIQLLFFNQETESFQKKSLQLWFLIKSFNSL